MEQELDGNCDFVAIEDPPTALFDISHTTLDNDERIAIFISTLLEYSGIKYYSEENFIVEALTFILLTCNIDVTDKFNLLFYQLQNDYVPWGFSAPECNIVENLNSVDVFESLVNIMLRLDVNRKVLQCIHCKTKCSCEMAATFIISELDLFTVQDPIIQVVEQIDNKAVERLTPEEINETSLINMLSKSFIVEIEEEQNTSFLHNGAKEERKISSLQNVMLSDFGTVDQVIDDREATLSIHQDEQPHCMNHDAWKGHNDEGIPIINFDAMFGHTDYDDLDLQYNCKV